MMKGKHSHELPSILGYHTEGELIHRGNLALLLPGTAHGLAATVVRLEVSSSSCTRVSSGL